MHLLPGFRTRIRIRTFLRRRVRGVLVVALLAGLCGGMGPSRAVAAETAPDPMVVYRQFAMQNEGDAGRGRVLFSDEQRLGCSKCHSTDSQALGAGPDLHSVGDQYSRSELIDAVLTPSAKIAVGYATTVVETKDGEEFAGVLKSLTADHLELMGGDGKRVAIATKDIREQHGSDRSLMPDGLQAGLSKGEFSDLIEFLVGLKQADHVLARHQGMPESIPTLAHPVKVVPILDREFRVPEASTNVTIGLVWLGEVPGHSGLFLAAHQAGKVWWVERAGDTAKVGEFADFTRETFSARGPNGLLGMAFHPRFRENRRYYTKQQRLVGGRITTYLFERRMDESARRDSGDSARQILEIPSVAEHHSGGCIQFGPDGFLYFGMGDSAPNFDPQGYAQDLGRLLGKMLRIDVDHREAGQEYAIPSDNPFRDRPGARPEIWASGLREPWRFSFDPATGDLWVADLGQERGDEVDLVRRGGNYGWNAYEGFEPFGFGQRVEGAAYQPPLFAGRRKHGTCMIGGCVYRGHRADSFTGVYVFGDHQSRRLWGLTQTAGALDRVREIGTLPQSVTCFTADESGELYAAGFQGMIYRLDLAGSRFDELASAGAPVSGR